MLKKNILKKLNQNKYLSFLFFLALLNMVAIFLFFGFQMRGDSDDYIPTIQWFSGAEVARPPLYRLLRPLGPILAVPFEFLGEGAGLIVQNILFYFFSVYLIFKITEFIFHNEKQALLASIFFITALPFLESGLSYLTDMGAWFFYLLSLYLTLFYFRNKNEKLIIINGFLSGLGVLMKENGGLGVLFFGMMILISKEFNIREKFLKILRFGIFFLIPILILQIIMYGFFDYTYWDWYLSNTSFYLDTEGGKFSLVLAHLSGLYRALGIIGWPLALLGLWREYKERSIERMKTYLALLPPSLFFLIWPSSSARVVFTFAPLGILFISKGLLYLKNIFGKDKGKLIGMTLILISIALSYYSHMRGDYFPFIRVEDLFR